MTDVRYQGSNKHTCLIPDTRYLTSDIWLPPPPGHKIDTHLGPRLCLGLFRFWPGRHSQPPWPGPGLRAGQTDQTPGNRPRPDRLIPIEARPAAGDPLAPAAILSPRPPRRPGALCVGLGGLSTVFVRWRPGSPPKASARRRARRRGAGFSGEMGGVAGLTRTRDPSGIGARDSVAH